MKMSNMLVSTLREVPAEAEIDSHKLMLRAGMIRKMAAGIYNYMPLGLKALKNVEEIVREEMNAAGAQEFLASAMLPAELWQESGRWDVYGAEMFRLKDRNNRDYCLGPTHEEVFTDIDIEFKRNIPEDLSSTINLINTLKGTVSDATLLSQLPFISDVNGELEAVQAQKKANIETYGFGLVGGSANEEEDEETSDEN